MRENESANVIILDKRRRLFYVLSRSGQVYPDSQYQSIKSVIQGILRPFKEGGSINEKVRPVIKNQAPELLK